MLFSCLFVANSIITRKNQNRIADLSFAFFVGRTIDDFSFKKHRRRTAAVEIHRVGRAEFERCYRAGGFYRDGHPVPW